MSRPRAADDFKTIRIRMEELRREKLPRQPTQATGAQIAGSSWPVRLWQEPFPGRVRRIVQGALVVGGCYLTRFGRPPAPTAANPDDAIGRRHLDPLLIFELGRLTRG